MGLNERGCLAAAAIGREEGERERGNGKCSKSMCLEEPGFSFVTIIHVHVHVPAR